jgi:Terminase RNaseH-like domain
MFDERQHFRQKYASTPTNLVNPDDILDTLFDKQLESLDPSKRFRACCTTRRAGKSESRIRFQASLMVRYPGSICIFGGLTQETATAVGWDLFLSICEQFKIKTKTNLKNMVITLPEYEDSSLAYFGLDSSEKGSRKILGRKLRSVVIDEAGSITVPLHRITFQYIRPALIDHAPFSYLDLISTPEVIPNTYFQRVITGEDVSFPWQVYRWTALDNPHVAKQFKEEMDSIPEAYKSTSEYKAHYLGEICVNLELLIYNISPKSIIAAPILTQDFIITLGVDLGYEDHSTIVVTAYNASLTDKLYVLKVFKQSELDLLEFLDVLQRYCSIYRPTQVVIDGAAKQSVETIRNRLPIPVIASDKHDKSTYIRLLSADITCGKVVFVVNECDDLLKEAETLIWDEKAKQKSILKEDYRCQQHALDALLYAWRMGWHFLHKATPQKVIVSANVEMDRYWKNIEERNSEREEILDTLFGVGYNILD